MATNLLSLFGHIQQQGELGRAQGQRSRLADLASQAYAAPAQQRSGFVQQAIATDPDAGFALNKQLQGDDDQRMQRVGQMAGMLLAAPEQSRAAIYGSQIVPEMHRLGLGDGLPDQWSDDLLPSVQQIAQQLGVGSGGNVQSTFVDAQGNRVAIMRDGSTQVLGRNAPNNQIIDTGAGFFGVNKGNLQAAPVMVGGQDGIQYATSDGQPIPEGELPAFRAAMEAANRGESATFPVQLRSAPKPQQAPAGYRYNGDALEAIPGGPADPQVQALGNDNGRNYVITTGPDGTIYRVNKLTGQADAVEGAQGGGASMANLAFKKDQLAVQKGTGANQIERGLKRIEDAVAELSKAKFFDGGPLDQYVIGPTKIGQELEQAGGSIMPALTALTRVPGVGSQSDWEGRLNMLQIPSARFSPEVNKRAITGLRAFVRDLKAAYQRAGIPFPDDVNDLQQPATGGFRVLD